MAAIAVSAIGCAGEEPTEPSETMELPTPPPSEASAVLDLEAMTDEELLAEARRSYQGFFDDIEEMREAGGSDYTSLTEWTEPEFAQAYDESMNSSLPEGFSLHGAQTILGMELAEGEWDSAEQVRANVCVSNDDVRVLGPSGEDATGKERGSKSLGEIEFWLSADGTRLVVRSERSLDDAMESLCE